jgi:hypothetical protein
MRKFVAAWCGSLLFLSASLASAAGIQGDYVEARTADVFTGPCISNAEVFVTGSQAVMAWKVNQGSWRGIDLGGLCVAAAVQATTTLSEDQPDKATTVLIVDEKASPAQRKALVAMAQELGGSRLRKIAAIKTARMSLKLEDHTVSMADSASEHGTHAMPRAPRASFWAAGLAQIVTRPLDENDHFCGNEVIAYDPLSQGVKALPAYTLGHEFKGEGLNTRWNDPNCRSSFVGHFAY